MATHKNKLLRGFAGVGICLMLGWGVSFLTVHRLEAQEAVSPAQAREGLRQAIELYKGHDYEKAAQYFSFIEPSLPTLSPTDRDDYAKFSSSNATALKSRQEGMAQLRQAETALTENRPAEAANLLKSLTANQYLSPMQKQQIDDLNRRVDGQAKNAAPQAKTDARSLLNAGRAALQQGDLAGAESLANQADNASSLMPAWLQPWNDSPAKLRRDIQTARSKQAPVVLPDKMPKSPEVAANNEPKNTTSKFGGFWPFGSSTPPKKDASERKIDEMMARQVVKDGFIFLQAGDLEKAQFLAIKAKELNATYGPNEPTPDQLLHEVQRAKGFAKSPDPVKPSDPIKPNDPIKASEPSKPAPKLEPLPKDADPRTLVKYGRSMLDKKQYDQADKACTQAALANARWGLFEDNPDKLRRDIQKSRQSFDRDESVRLLVEARKLYMQGKLEEAEKSAYKAQQLHGPYGVFDFGDRPGKLLEEIGKAKLARGPVDRNDKPADVAKNLPNKTGVPFEVPAATQSPTKNQAIIMVREARELERQNLLTDARRKALEARQLKATFLPEEDSPDTVLGSLAAKCDRQIVAHLQHAIKCANEADDAQRFEKAQVQILAARKLAQAFDLDTGKIDQTAHQLQQVANGGARSMNQFVGLDPSKHSVLPPVVEPSTGDPKKDALRKLAREKFAQAQLELSHGKTAQARKMAEELFNPEFGIQADVLKLIRSISAEEHNQQILEAKRNFDAGLEAFLQKDYAKAMFIFRSVDSPMLPDMYQARLRDIMATREMQPIMQAQYEKKALQGEKIIEKRPTEGALDVRPSHLEEITAKEAVQYQMLRQRGQDALRSAHEMFKNNQENEAIETLRHFNEQVAIAGIDPQKAAELRRLPEARIQQYKADLADRKLRKLDTSGQYAMKHDEGARQRLVSERQKEVAEKMKVVNELMSQNKFKEAEVALKQVRELDPENLAALAARHIIANKLAQMDYDRTTHQNDRWIMKGLDHGLGTYVDEKDPIKFDKDRIKRRDKEAGAIPHNLTDPKERAIEYRLRQPISLNFKDVPLQQAIKDLTLMSGIQVQPDIAAMQDAKVNLDAPLSINIENVDMKSALKIMLNQLRLTYTIENQCLMITTPDKTVGRLVRVTYPVADLIVAVPDHQMPDVLNMTKALERAMMPAGPYGGQMMTPQAYPFGAGEPVSSHSGGLGGAFGGQGNRHGPGGVQGSQNPDQSKAAMAAVLKELIQNTVAKNSWEAVGGNGSIQYFPMGMAMVINQPQEVQEEVQLLLATLRKLQDLQVSIELRAVLVSETFFERIGVDFDMNISAIKKAGNAALLAGDLPTAISKGAISGLTSAGTLTPDLGFPIRNSTFNFTTPTFGGYQPEAGLSLGLAFLSEIQVFMFLEAVQGDRRAHIMQAPKLTVFNGQLADLFGQQIFNRPTVLNLQPQPLLNGQFIMSVQPNFMPFGLGMTVQPVVSPDRRFVRLNISPQLAAGMQDPAGALVIAVPGAVGGAPFGPPNFGVQPQLPNQPLNVIMQPTAVNLQVANTTVNVPDGGTVLLGGFKFLAEERTEYGPPILSKIPYLSRLFRNVGWSRDSSTMIYLVTARIIMVQEEERLFMGELEPIPGR